MAPRIAIIYYSMYGHVGTLATAISKGIETAGGKADVLQVAETLSQAVLDKMHAPAKSSHPVAEPSSKWRAFWDQTGGLWATGALSGKYAGLFVATGTPGGGQESTAVAAMSTLAHHGLIYVPLGYKEARSFLSNLDEAHGGSPWGASTFAGALMDHESQRIWSLKLRKFKEGVSMRKCQEYSFSSLQVFKA